MFIIFHIDSGIIINDKKMRREIMEETPIKKVEGTVKLKRLDPWSLAKVYAIFGVIGGFIAGIVFTIIALMVGSIANSFTNTTIANPSMFMTGLGALSIIIMPIVGAICGLIGGIIAAVLYNIVAKWVGGIEMKFE
jgi:hypothetical protein